MELNEVQRSSREQFARQSHRYAKGHILENVDDVRDALAFMDLPSGAEILDVATGAGHTGLLFAALGHRVTVSDLAQPMLDRTLEAARQRGLQIEARLHPAEQLPYADESFHLVSCRVAAHHFSSPHKFVSECSRALRPGGYLLVIDGTVEDGQTEAEEWMHEVEKLRDPSHQRLITPGQWRQMCEANRLRVEHSILHAYRQPDLNWYFETAATRAENRERVLDLVEHAPASARKLFRIATEDGKIVWWWQRLTLIACKAA